MTPIRLDHLTVTAMTLAEGVAWIEQSLGLPLAGGGKHPRMGTHNRLFSLGDCYLEVIAIDPEADQPERPRWFGLDQRIGPPGLTNWVAACDDLTAAAGFCPVNMRQALSLERGDLRWDMLVPDDGQPAFDGAFPALIQWQGSRHPCQSLPPTNASLIGFLITHPAAGELAINPAFSDPRIQIRPGQSPKLEARILTPQGERLLT